MELPKSLIGIHKIKQFFTFRIIFLFLLYFFILIAIIPVGHFTDSADYLLGGCLISKGQVLYRDFFSNHFPGMYYFVALIFKLVGRCGLYLPRVIFYLFFVATTTLFFSITKNFLTTIVIILLFAFLGLYDKTIFPLTESFLINTSIFIFLLIFYRKKLDNSWFFVIYSFIQTSLLIFEPIYFPVTLLLAVYVYYFESRSLKLVLISFIPSLIFWFNMDWKYFWNVVVIFNFKYYPLNIFGQYIAYFKFQLINLLSFVHLANSNLNNLDRYSLLFELAVFSFSIIAVYFAWKKQIISPMKLLFFGLLCVFLSFHPGGFHTLPLIFLLIIFNLHILAKEIKFKWTFLLVIFLIALRLFGGPYFFWLKNKNQDPTISQMVDIVKIKTNKSDKILIYPYQPEVYLLTNRSPGSYYNALPWFSNDEESRRKIIKDIAKNKVRIIIFSDNKNLVLYNKYKIFSRKIIQSLQNSRDFNFEKKTNLTYFIRND